MDIMKRKGTRCFIRKQCISEICSVYGVDPLFTFGIQPFNRFFFLEMFCIVDSKVSNYIKYGKPSYR
jgi:hypothetical protein